MTIVEILDGCEKEDAWHVWVEGYGGGVGWTYVKPLPKREIAVEFAKALAKAQDADKALGNTVAVTLGDTIYWSSATIREPPPSEPP